MFACLSVSVYDVCLCVSRVKAAQTHLVGAQVLDVVVDCEFKGAPVGDIDPRTPSPLSDVCMSESVSG